MSLIVMGPGEGRWVRDGKMPILWVPLFVLVAVKISQCLLLMVGATSPARETKGLWRGSNPRD